MQKPYDELIKAIETAFDGVQLSDSDPTLADCIMAEDWFSEESKEIAKGKDLRTDWKNIQDEWIEKYDFAFSFGNQFTTQFLLPAYLIWILKYARSTDSSTPDRTIYEISDLCKDKQIDEQGKRKIDCLSAPQLSCIKKFLKYMINQHPNHCHLEAAEKALNRINKHIESISS